MTRTIKALNLWQPWASGVALGLKRFKTRHWATRYRGLLAVHAATHKHLADENAALLDMTDWLCDREADPSVLSPLCDLKALPRGAVLCIVGLTGWMRTEAVAEGLDATECALGNYAPGRYAWRLEPVVTFDEPIPARGRQGLWDWPVPEGIEAALAKAAAG